MRRVMWWLLFLRMVIMIMIIVTAIPVRSMHDEIRLIILWIQVTVQLHFLYLSRRERRLVGFGLDYMMCEREREKVEGSIYIYIYTEIKKML